MSNRPDFNKMKSYEDFIKYYWYREELSLICKQLGLDYSGTKKELNNSIKEYFSGNLITKKNLYNSKKSVTREVTLNSPLLECGFSFNAYFREFFAKQIGVKNFKFTSDMAAAWRKVKSEQDKTFTIQNMIDIYFHRSDYAKYDNSVCEWNKFLKDFCDDKRNEHFSHKMKAASILWNIVRDSSLPKIYSHDLVKQYENMLSNK